jgi:hypothetical protein
MAARPLPFLCYQGIAGRPRPFSYQGAQAEDVIGDRAPLGEGAASGGKYGSNWRAVARNDRDREAAAGGGGSGDCASVGSPQPSPRSRVARSESRSARGRKAVEAPAGGDSAPRRGRSRRTVGPAPGPAPEVLVVRFDGCTMSQRLAHDAEASISRSVPPASDTAPS